MAAPLLPGIFQRVERAQVNFLNLHSQFTEHFSHPENQCRLIPAFTSADEGEIRAEIREPLPESWSLLVSDIVCDLRFALDNLAYELVIANSGMDPPPNARAIEFPILAKGKMTPGSSRAIEQMEPWVQRLIESMQPYHDIASGTPPRNQALLALNEMCNTYKHRLLVPVLVKVESAKLTITTHQCTVSDIAQVEDLHEVKNGSTIATFRVNRHTDEATVDIETQPFTGLGFPAGVFAEFNNIIDFSTKEIHIVRAIVAALTEIQWGSPMDLPEAAPYFVTPLAVTVPNLYGP